jgi:hypothetical protein
VYKVLTAVAVVAMTALSTVIIATILLHSSISKQSGQIRALEHAEHSDQKQITTLEGEVRATGKHAS